VNDVAPDVGKPAATVQQADRSSLPAPQPLSPPDGARLNSFPLKTVLQWSAVSGAVGYLVRVQYHDRTSPTGWRPFAFRRVTEPPFEFNFVGSQPGRWRVWAIDQNGAVGVSTSWINFDYSPH
jgi:eukaryotic-like serine/threonine-protein kinase